MNTAVKLATTSVAFAVMASLFATSAEACGVPHFGQGAQAMGANALASAVTVPGASAQALGNIHLVPQASSNGNGNGGSQGHAPITGMWVFKYYALGNVSGPPDGFQIDTGLQQWHDDGIEISNSGARPPVIGDVCFGVWTQKGDSTYSLTHWGLSWTPEQTFIGPAVIREFNIKLDSTGNSFSGNFTIQQYDSPAVSPPLLPDLTDLSHPDPMGYVQGVVTATRITAD